MSRLYLGLWLLALLLGLLAGVFIGWHLHPAPRVVVEDLRPVAAQRQSDGSLIAARSAAPATPLEPPHALPRGSREERRIAVTVQPRREDCPPISLDLSLLQLDGGRRVLASSPDGEVIQALDLPLEATLVPPPKRGWAAGASLDQYAGQPGLWLERDLGRFRVGADLVMDEGGALQGRARLGWTF
ncbi:hypothetical protein [Solimonas sp. SE-A11]|uniref:hypothetical protein n=1 Tax=Solimonas sp. SE-A11 TaxID=3054954 RepID=UPI00259D115E|nr:hypothetical protein [Solimonas sp. SE-A11]MDM4772752.1 hypothetical protein [Solimonas sp. SE-A11]